MKRLGLQWQILFLMAPIICLAVFVSGYFTYYQTRQALAEAAARQLTDAAREATEKISLLIANVTSQQFNSKVEYVMVSQRNGFLQQGLPVEIYILDNAGSVLYAAGGAAGEATSLPLAVRQQVSQRKAGWERQSWDGHAHVLAYYQIMERDWVYLVVVDEVYYLRPVLAIRTWSQATGLVAILLTLLVAVLVARHLTRPLLAMQQVMARVEGGDLTARLNPAGSAEAAALAGSFNHMLDQLGHLMATVQEATGELARAQGDLYTVVAKAQEDTEQVTTAMESIAAGAEEQMAATQEAGAGTTRVAAHLEEIRRHLAAISASGRDMLAAVDISQEQLARAVAQVEDLASRSARIAATVEGLEDHSALIESLMAAIDQIAEETNLLALNAAIEAARAGEQGRGFAVVASKVRELAGSSASTAAQVTAIVNRVRQDTSQALEVARAGAGAAAGTRELIQRMAASLAGLMQLVRQTEKDLQEVAGSTEGISRGMQEIVAVTGVLGETTATAADAAQEVAARTQDFRQQMDQVAAAAATLQAVARRLEGAVGQFQIVG
ncbi:MAG: methyl-accepting chemotaxis protein [Clostridia bacterium]|nr:methyl-accepting chemotaxis protein [Clostridia bacterium]